jgi:hypothetical protein
MKPNAFAAIRNLMFLAGAMTVLWMTSRQRRQRRGAAGERMELYGDHDDLIGV